MMRKNRPNILFIIGGLFVVLGFILPFLMVLIVIPKLLWLELVVAIMQSLGVVLGLVGSVMYVVDKRDKDK